MKEKEFTITGLEENAKLPAYLWTAEKALPKALIVICHGMMEHAERYKSFAASLVPQGYAILAYTQRGHKGAVKDKADYGVLSEKTDGFRLLVEDLESIIRREAAAYPTLPIVLLGHSMGSFVAQAVAARAKVKLAGLILSGSNLQSTFEAKVGHFIARRIVKKGGRRASGGLVEKLALGNNNKAFAPARTPVDWLARNVDDVNAYMNDEWCGGHFPAGFYEDFMHFFIELNKIRKYTPTTLPILLISGEKDPVGHFAKGVKKLAKAYQRIGVQDLTMHIYPKDRHEVLFETDREIVIRDALTYLDQHFAS